MRKKAKKRSKSEASDLSFKQKLKAFFMPVQLFVTSMCDYVNQLPAVIAFKKTRDRISEKLRVLILAFFALLAPCWNFLFLWKSKPKTDNS